MPAETFVISNEIFAERIHLVNSEETITTEHIVTTEITENAEQLTMEQTDNTITIETNLQDETSRVVARPEQRTQELLPEELQLLNDFSNSRTLEQVKLEKKPSTSITDVIISELLEKRFESSEAVVVSRLAYINQISDLVNQHDTLVNAVLALAEEFNVMLPCDKINYTTQEIMRVNIPVKRDGCFNAHELALITIYLRKKMASFPATSSELNTRIATLEANSKFKDALILGHKNRVEELQKIKPFMVDVFVLKRQGSERYLYLDEKKRIKSSKSLTKDVLFTSQQDAETFLIHAIKNLSSSKVKKIPNYQIIQLSYFAPLPASKKLHEVLKNAYKF